MTKIKNTKKGMAKKTLSMSLVVAMLATSNVPVWAAEFSDGSDDVATQAETFTDETEATPVVEDTTADVATESVSNNAYSVTPTFENLPTNKTVVWTASQSGTEDNKKVKAEFTVSAAEGTKTEGISYYYAWKIGDVAAGEKKFYLGEKETATLILSAADAGKTAVLCIYAKDNTGKNVWHYTSDEIQIKAAQDSALEGITISDDWKKRTYNGEEQVIDADGLSWGSIEEDQKKYYKISVSGNTKSVTDDGVTVTIESQKPGYTGSKTLKYEIAPLELDGTGEKLISKHFEATLKTTNFTYTGKVIRVKASDVTLIDKDTKENLSGYLKADDKGYVSLAKTNVQGAGEVALRLNLITGQPESGSKNYSIAAVGTPLGASDADGYRTVETSNKATVAVRDLSTVDVAIKAKAIPAANTTVTLSEADVTFTDKTTKETLDLFDDVDLTIPKTATSKGSYDVTIEPKTAHDNVTGKTTAKLNLVAADISPATFTGSEVTTNEEYTGAAITKTEKQLGSLTLNGKAIDKSEYTIEYANNTNVGTAKLIVKGKGSFEGSEAVFNFEINPAAVADATITANKSVEVKDTQNASDYKDNLGLVVKAKNANGKEFTLVNGTDYVVKYSYKDDTNKVAGGTVVANITITNKNFIKDNAKQFTKEVPIAQRALKPENIKLKENDFTYTGSAITPDFDIVVDGHVYGKDDFVYTYTNNINAGTATITVKGKRNSSGVTKFDPNTEAKLTYEIKPADASKLVGVIASEQYRGYSIEIPADGINLKLGDNVIDVEKNFKLTYGENLNIGEGTVTLTPKNGNFTGTKTLTFDIVGSNISAKDAIKTYDSNGIETNSNFYYDGSAHTYAKAIASITNGSKKLVEGTDYDLVYVDNVYGKKTKFTETRKDDDEPETVTYYKQVGAILAVAKGTYGGNLTTDDKESVVNGIYTDAAGNKIKNVIAIKTFDIRPQFVSRSCITVKNATYAGGLELKPVVTVIVKGVTLVEGKDYDLYIEGSDLSNVTTGKTNWVGIKFKNGYCGSTYNNEEVYDYGYQWGIDKFDLANADVTVTDGKISVKCGKVDVDTTEYTTTANGDGTTTITAAKTSKNYTGAKTVRTNGTTDAEKPEAPMITNVKVTGNKATVILSGESDGAAGYDYVISTDRDCITNKDYDVVNKNQVKTESTFEYVGQGTYYAYCHAWKRDANGKKVFSDWSNAYPFVVSAITPSQPVITSVKVSGSTVTVTYTKASNADGYDVVLGTSTKKVNGETRPVEYGKLVKKNIKGNVVTATFKNVKKGTYYAGLHAFNRTSEDGKKVFSQWSNVKKVTVK